MMLIVLPLLLLIIVVRMRIERFVLQETLNSFFFTQRHWLYSLLHRQFIVESINLWESLFSASLSSETN